MFLPFVGSSLAEATVLGEPIAPTWTETIGPNPLHFFLVSCRQSGALVRPARSFAVFPPTGCATPRFSRRVETIEVRSLSRRDFHAFHPDRRAFYAPNCAWICRSFR